MKSSTTLGAICAATIASAAVATPVTFSFSDASGLSGEAAFELLDSDTMQISIRNTSTGAPVGFDSSDILLTSVSWGFGDTGASIIGGSARIGAASHSLNFDAGSFAANSDVSGEWGYGNGGGTGLHQHYVSGNQAGTTAFGGPNLDGSPNLNGPQGGLISSMFTESDLGGLGAIQDQIIVTVDLDTMLSDLAFLEEVTFEFGSDAAFFTVPTPSSVALLGLGGLIAGTRRR